jgi:tetratricopeptide (TPR) repeat protein
MLTMYRSRRILSSIGAVLLIALAAGIFLRRHALVASQAAKPSAAKKGGPVQSAPARSSTIQTHRNIGKAYYEQAKYPEATAEFQKVIASTQAMATDHLDLGLGLMQADRLDEALGEMTTAKQMDSKLVAADYNLGILYKRESRYPDAETALKRVTEADPREPAAWLNLGVVYFSQGKLQDALSAYQHVLDMGFGRAQNFYVAALFRTSTALFRLKKTAEANKYLELHAKMKDKVPSVSVQTAALEGGKYGAILVPTIPPTPSPDTARTASIGFADITSKLGISLPAVKLPPTDPTHLLAAQLAGATVAVGDYDGDGHSDLYVVVPAGQNHLLHNNGDGTLTDVTEKAGLLGQGASISATFADYDNCGHPSLFVAGVDGVTVYHNNGNGTFTDVTEKAGLRKSERGRPGPLATQAVLFDADDDGFLDLVVTVYTDLGAPQRTGALSFPDDFPGAQSRFYRNNGDGTFTDATASSGLESARGKMRGAVFADFNNDGYSDLLFFRDDGPPLLFINQGEDKFVDRTAEAGPALSRASALDAQVADFNHDGNFDVALWSPSGVAVLLNRGGGRFEAVEHLPPVAPPRSRSAFRGTVADLNADGFAGLLVMDTNGKTHFIANHMGSFQEESLAWPIQGSNALGHLIPSWLGTPGKLDLLSVTDEGQLRAFEKKGPPARWLEVKLNGYKSNKLGVGTVVEVKAGNFYEKVFATGDPVRVYTGNLAKLDVVRVTWPNQIVQNSIDVATNKSIEVRESERLASSCPFLYVWDGKRFVFYTDILGMSPLGELSPDGTWSTPNPQEFVRLPSDLHSRDGVFAFQVTDEMREVDFVDQLRLIAIDHPATEEVYSNEIAAATPVAPALFAVREKRFPVSAVDDEGRNVLPELLDADGRYPTGFGRNRILGLADLHTLTLDLGEFAETAPIALWLRGWVFWTDSNGSRALMTNSKLKMVSPYLEVRDAQGQWTTVVPDMGLPSGTNRTMRVDLTGKFPTRDHHVRIVTNLCVYWDQVFLSTDDAPVAAVYDRRNSIAAAAISDSVGAGAERSHDLPLLSANLHYRGFSKPVSDPTHVKPDFFEYSSLLGDAPWNPMAGNYTRYGPVEKLIGAADDRPVVMAVGDEITVEFSGIDLPPLKPGWKRDFFLYTAGYAKDGEPNSAYSRVVGPMPFRQMSKFPYAPPEHFPDDAEHKQYLHEFETRPGRALIPPLPPAVQ